MRFNLAHIVPHPRQHGLNGYKEVIDAVQWGLTAAGHEAIYSFNGLEHEARNIVFGAQMLPVDIQQQLRPDTVVYNFEQLRNVQPADIRPEVRYFAGRFEIWDYAPPNVGEWSRLGAHGPVRLVPVGYAPVLERIPKRANQDIDVLIYGLPSDDRLGMFKALCGVGLTCVFLCGLYGEARDELISRSKVIVNGSMYTASRLFEIVRASYLFANRKAVVSLIEGDSFVEPDMVGAFHQASRPTLVDDVLRLVDDSAERQRLEERGHSAIRKRDMKTIAEAALAG